MPLALHNIQHLCPPLATVMINTYREATDLFVDGSNLYSVEGTTQGDPLAMPFYAMATIPLINKLGENSTTKQVWYADDASARYLTFVLGGRNYPILVLLSTIMPMLPRPGS